MERSKKTSSKKDARKSDYKIGDNKPKKDLDWELIR